MWRSLGVLLAPFWIRVGIRVTRKWRKHCILRSILTTSRLFEFVAFTNTLYFTTFLTTFGLLRSSSSLRVSHTLMSRSSRNHGNLNAFSLLSGSANSSRNSSDKPFPYQENQENVVFVAFLTTFGVLESSSSLCFPRTARTQPSRNHCTLHAFWLLSGPWIPFEILLPIPSLIREIMKTVYFTAFWFIHTWSMDSVRKVVFVPLAFCSTSLSFR